MIKNIGMSPKLDESIHSFFLRIMLRTGRENFTTIITQGGWGDTPSIPYEIRNELDMHDAHLFFYLFERRSYRKVNLFDNDFSNVTLFRKTFFPDKKKSSCGRSVPLRFCPLCIEAQLVEQGYSYFKSDWLNTTFCKIHFVPLQEVKRSLSYSKTRDSLKSIIFAEWNKVSDSVSVVVSHPTVVVKELNLDDVKERLAISFAPCAKDFLLGYFVRLTNYYPSGCFSVVDYGCLSENDKYFLSRKKRRDFLKTRLEEAYNYELDNNCSSFMEHCSKFIEFKVVVYFGVDHYIVKSKSKKCLDCLRHKPMDSNTCSAVETINCLAIVLPKQGNICDMFLDNIEKRVELYQKRLKVDYGERFVRRSIEKSRVIFASGGLDSYRKKRESRLKQAAKALADW